MASPQKKLKVLAMHGYLQTAKAFKDKTGSFRRMVQKKVDFHYLDGPFVVPPPDWWLQPQREKNGESPADAEVPAAEVSTAECRAWYLPVDGERPVLCTKYDKWMDGLEFVLKWIEDNGGVDGILAFSQASVLAELVAAILSPAALKPENENLYKLRQELESKGLLGRVQHIRFFIFAGAFPTTDLHLVNVMSEVNGPIEFPSFHIIGETDAIVGKERGVAVSQLFKDPEVIVHAGGHFLATGAQVKDQLNIFIDRFTSS